MTDMATKDETNHAVENGKGWYQNILDLLERLEQAQAQEGIECGECGGYGVIYGGQTGDGEDEECPVCDGMGTITPDFTEDDVIQEIHESPLSVQVRGGWHSPGDPEGTEPEEYEVLLSTGGPALRIVGRLGRFCLPETAELQWQDWFKPWTPCYVTDDQEEVLLRFVSHFYFGD